KRHFRPDTGKKMRGGMKLISLFGLISFALQIAAILLKGDFDIPASIVGGMFYLTSLFLFFWAVRATLQHRLTLAYSTDEPQFLLKTGPYGFIRHPFYTAYSLFWLAGLTATGQWWLLLPIVVMFSLYFRAARMEEEKFYVSRVFQKDYSQ